MVAREHSTRSYGNVLACRLWPKLCLSLLARTPSANVEEKQVMQTGLNMLAAWAVTLMIGSTAATATPIITAVTSSGAGSAFINPDPPFGPTFAGIRKEFTGVGPLNLTFTVGN